jgi:4-hydroxy-3-polyprenylbenzoate decarboxylase
MSPGLNLKTSRRDLVEAIAETRRKPGVTSRVVATGRCEEHVSTADAAALTKIPVPVLHNGDGGRYRDTGTRSCAPADARWTKWLIARTMVVDR